MTASPTPAELLCEVAALRRRARAQRHAYWFPLVLFGLISALAAPLYIQPPRGPDGADATTGSAGLARVLGGDDQATAEPRLIYWLVALSAGFAATVWWYRRHAQRAGVQTPTRGYVIAGLASGAVVISLPYWLGLASTTYTGAVAVQPIEMAIYRGAIAFFVIAVGLCVLARLERSPGLAVVAALHAGSAVFAAAYDLENLVLRLGWSPRGDEWRYAGLPNVLLPALVLLVGGGIAAAVQLRNRAKA
ncbi:MAG: hypothetical protein JWO79_111 [Actinomycetia bacterium]|nr:hypothetical protein [Actinomycetes bacterium]